MPDQTFTEILHLAAITVLARRADQYRTLVDSAITGSGEVTEEVGNQIVALGLYLHSGVQHAFKAGIGGDDICDATGWGREVIALLLSMPVAGGDDVNEIIAHLPEFPEN